MQLLADTKSYLNQIPAPVADFLKRALIVFLVWKVVYHLILVPIRIPDKPLTDLTAATTGYLYRNLLHQKNISYRQDFSDPNFPKAALYINNQRSIGIADACNGLELFVLYVGFIICIPTTIKRQTSFIILGVIIIYVANSFRCLGLAWLNFNHYAIANFAHHYLFKMIIYAMIFYGWVLYSKKFFSHAS